ncbi:MAG: hypothetical protein ACOX6U_09210 [Oscillospiraceae bacterium]|jgi:hypothetical protein
MYLIQRIENGTVVLERRFQTKAAAKAYYVRWMQDPFLYHQLVVDGKPFTTGQAEQLFQLGRKA